ncbi:Lin0512 family protein [Virgibacillus oceani]
MKQVLFIQAGTGMDVHGQDVSKAAVRATENAIWYNSMPGIDKMMPDGNVENMKVTVRLAVPLDREKVDVEKVKKAIPYGNVTVDVTEGGMATSSGVILKEKEDGNDLMYMVNASVEVGY